MGWDVMGCVRSLGEGPLCVREDCVRQCLCGKPKRVGFVMGRGKERRERLEVPVDVQGSATASGMGHGVSQREKGRVHVCLCVCIEGGG